MERTELVIIGAGAAGLATAYEARPIGLEAQLLDAADEPGGSWPRHYDSLTLFSPARYSALPGRPMPGDPDHYPRRDEIVAYLRDYATQFGSAIHLGERVEAVRSQPDGRLLTTTATGLAISSRLVIAATGAFDAPHRPAIAGLEAFTGTVLHSSEYRSPTGWEDARVVVVGAGNSAVQIAADLAPVARVTLATRRPIAWVKQELLGRDLHWWLSTTRLDVAPLGRWLHRLPVAVLDSGHYRAAVAAGRPDRRPMFNRLDGDEVVWPDGTRERVDLLILATGYRAHFPFLEHTAALAPDGTPLHIGGVSTAVPGLGYVGLEFQRSFSSATVRGFARDARHVLANLTRATQPTRRAHRRGARHRRVGERGTDSDTATGTEDTSRATDERTAWERRRRGEGRHAVDHLRVDLAMAVAGRLLESPVLETGDFSDFAAGRAWARSPDE